MTMYGQGAKRSSWALRAIGAIVAGLAIAGAVAAALWMFGDKPLSFGKVGASSARVSTDMAVVATVNGEDVRQAEIASIMSTGVDRATALDRAITKALAAQSARHTYAADAEEAISVATREVLAQIYIAKRTKSLLDALSDAEVTAYYEKELKSSDFDRYKVSVAAFTNLDDAKVVVERVMKAVNAGGQVPVGEFAQFKLVADGAQEHVLAQQVPAGLGWVVKQLKPGQYSQLVAVPGGHYMVYLHDIKPGVIPPRKDVEAVIKQVLVGRKLDQEVSDLRKKAQISLK